MLWPLPALLAWAAAWGLHLTLLHLGAGTAVALAVATAAGGAASLLGSTRWRRVFIALGFPLSLLASGLGAGVSAWLWLMPLGVLLLLYPLNAWRDAPLFPTPSGGLDGLAQLLPLQAQAGVLDAGCGLGAGLRELQRQYPAARLHGLEWSWPLRWACALRCRQARVRRADIWVADWSAYDLVYLFQRPESMARAWHKAGRELRAGSWLVSMEFAVPDVQPHCTLACVDGRTVWLYRVERDAASA